MSVKWGIDLRALAMLRRIARATEGIEEQLRHQNERAFPPLHEKTLGVPKLVISKRKPEDKQNGA